MERTENMVVENLDGIIRIEMVAKGENEMDNLRSEMLDWFEDFVKREADCNRHVVTTYEPIPRRKEPSDYVRAKDIEFGIKHVMKLRNLLDSYIVLKSLDARCGEVVQIPIRHEQYMDIIWKAYSFIDHVLKRYMDADESRFPDDYPF